MNLKEMLVEKVDFGDYLNAVHAAGFNKKYHAYIRYGRITNTLHFNSHEHALDEFLSNSYARRIAVNNKGTWQRYGARDIFKDKNLLARVVSILDDDKYKSNYFEFVFMEKDPHYPVIFRLTTTDSGLLVTELESPKLDLELISTNFDMNDKFAKIDAALFRKSKSNEVLQDMQLSL